jgi:2-polyprenyl-3-methyl-5-hydroxy-6-metoxy-1,4-benzoquinol methylase
MTDQNARVLDQFGRQADAYAALVNAPGPPHADPLIALIDPTPSDRVLDVGCGSGQFAVSIAPLVAEVLGIDLTEAMLDTARVHQAKVGVANVRWERGDSTCLPVGSGAFDVVVSRSMFHHAADPAGTLAEMRRACAPGGRIFVMDLTPTPAKGPAFDAIELLRDPSHNHALTPEELRRLGSDLGLEEIAVRSRTTSLPLEAVLATSFPGPGIVDRVRTLFARDADAGGDAFGMAAQWQDGAVWVSYPMTTVCWQG